MSARKYAALLTDRGPRPRPTIPTVMRTPFTLPTQPNAYESKLVFTPPPKDLYFYRGQFCGLRIEDAPLVPGASDKNPSCVMACLLDNYPAWVQHEFLYTYASYGYTHLQRSLGHALGYGHSLASYIKLSQIAQGEYGLFTDQWLIANELPGWAPNQDATYWAPILLPHIAALLDAGVIDSICPSWQMDQVQGGAPGNPTISIIKLVADAVPKEVPVYTHWVNEAVAWWKTGGEVWTDEYQSLNVHDRFTWWIAMQPYLTGAYYQGHTGTARTDWGTYQGRIRDTLNPFTGDPGKGPMGQSYRRGFAENFRFVTFEHTAQDQFDGSASGTICSEDEGDMDGYVLMCTTSDWDHTGVSGYGNGARQPDGSPL
jgi:hypothetical protein